MDVNMYESQAGSIDVDDIATNSNNRIALRRLQINEASKYVSLFIGFEDWDDEEESGYFPEGAYDMGWVGYFIGKSGHLKNLLIRPFEPPSGASVRDVLDPFFQRC